MKGGNLVAKEKLMEKEQHINVDKALDAQVSWIIIKGIICEVCIHTSVCFGISLIIVLLGNSTQKLLSW